VIAVAREAPARMTTVHPMVWSRAAVAATGLTLEAVVAAVLLVGPPPPEMLWSSILAVAHVTAALLLTACPGVPRCHRLLAAASMLTVPGAGVGLALVVFATKGRGSIARESFRDAPGSFSRSGLPAPARLGSRSTCDALLGDDEEARRLALTALARRADTEAIALLRWAAASHDPDLALSAALALDEIGERAERRPTGRARILEVNRATG